MKELAAVLGPMLSHVWQQTSFRDVLYALTIRLLLLGVLCGSGWIGLNGGNIPMQFTIDFAEILGWFGEHTWTWLIPAIIGWYSAAGKFVMKKMGKPDWDRGDDSAPQVIVWMLSPLIFPAWFIGSFISGGMIPSPFVKTKKG